MLKSVDLIACEDTRHSIVLLNAYEIKKPLICCHKFNEKTVSIQIIEKIKSGLNIAYISDAGTPCISDPGELILKEAIKNNIEYTVIPGATAFVNALVLSGFNATKFMFIGFLPSKNTDRKNLLNSLLYIESTLIFYCAPHDINKDIKSIYDVFGQRRYSAVKEITKMFERVIFGNLSEGITEEIKGEYVLIVEGGKKKENPLNSLEIIEHIKYYTDNGFKQMEAVKQTAKDRKLTKNEVYKYTIKN